MVFFAAAAANQNDLVAREAQAAGSEMVRLVNGGVEFEADLQTAYRFCLQSRVCTRLLLGLFHDDDVLDGDDLYDASLQIPWETWLDPSKTFTVTITALHCEWLRNSTFGAIRLKDAIVDRLKERFEGQRPSVDFEHPDVTFHLHIEDREVSWYLDFSGKSMHRRGYRIGNTEAVLKENLAAALLYRTEWHKSVLDGNSELLLDPFCGSGTIVVEAALMATDTAPGLIDTAKYAFLKLDMHDPDLWEEVLDEAYERSLEGKKRSVELFGWDIDPKAIALAQAHAKNAGVDNFVSFVVRDFTTATASIIPAGIHAIVTDPPYGMRSAGETPIEELYLSTGKLINTLFPGCSVSILCGDKELLSYIDMKPERTNSLFNGPIECQLAHYHVFTAEQRQEMIDKGVERKQIRLSQALSEGAQMAFNRLKKNIERIKPLMEEQGVTSYRIYDADMPEYSAAIDLYEGKYISLQEYAPPATIDPYAASRRLEELIDATERITGIEHDYIFVKQRKEQKGSGQYEKTGSTGKFLIIRENGLKFLVNFHDYLDTGIFLDHRPVRKMIMDMATEKRFLNLFCYTGTATVHAASGGALSTVSVDASATYLDWAIRNMKMNGHDGMNHFYYREDCIDWLQSNHDVFDLVFCDPPTFSNSKMRRVFDVDRDQCRLIHSIMRHLSPTGTLIFSTNFRKFSLDQELIDEYSVQDITASTIGDDFSRDPKIHQCYLISHKKAVVKLQKRELLPHTVKRVVRKKE